VLDDHPRKDRSETAGRKRPRISGRDRLQRADAHIESAFRRTTRNLTSRLNADALPPELSKLCQKRSVRTAEF
jgi:hypothetical protein